LQYYLFNQHMLVSMYNRAFRDEGYSDHEDNHEDDDDNYFVNVVYV
jgi:hypothetical protein